MRNLVLILAIAATAFGGYHYHLRHPEILERVREILRLDGEDGSAPSRTTSVHGGVATGGIRTISRGSRVDVKKYVDPHGRTIIDFTADW